MRRVLLALPVAAVVVTALLLAMREFVPVGRARAIYGVDVSRPTTDKKTHMLVETPKEVIICFCFEPPSPPSSPLPPPLEPIKPQPMPRDHFPRPEPGNPGSVFSRNIVDHCERHRVGPVRSPKGGKHGDRVTVEFTIAADGTLGDVTVIESTNPGINDDVIRMVERWRYVRSPRCEGQLAMTDEPRTVRHQIRFEKDG